MEAPALGHAQAREQQPLPQCLTAGAYLTDESNLFRCISADDPAQPDATVLLEDCMSLEVLILPMDEIDTAHFRFVSRSR